MDAVIFRPDLGEPVADVPSQHERVGSRFPTLRLVGDETEIRYGCQFNLFGRHFVELRNYNFHGAIGLLSKTSGSPRVRIVDEVFHYEITCARLADLVERSERGAENMKQRQGDLPSVRSFE
jgi:hypothetical protein